MTTSDPRLFILDDITTESERKNMRVSNSLKFAFALWLVFIAVQVHAAISHGRQSKETTIHGAP